MFLYLQPNKRDVNIMLIIPVKDGESIDRALKRYKRKYDRTKVVRELRKRQQFTKPSITKRQEVLRAAYKQRMQSKEEA